MRPNISVIVDSRSQVKTFEMSLVLSITTKPLIRVDDNVKLFSRVVTFNCKVHLKLKHVTRNILINKNAELCNSGVRNRYTRYQK